MTQPQTPTTGSTQHHQHQPIPHTRRWTSHATTLEYTTYNHAPALQATTHTTTMEWGISRITTVTRTLWVSSPNTCTLTTHHSPQAAREQLLPPFRESEGTPVEPCLLLAMYAPSLTEAIEDSLRSTLQEATMAYLAAQHDPHTPHH